MPPKRKSITRGKSEATKKKHQKSARSTPSEDNHDSEPADEPLPVKITSNIPLPTLKLDADLPDRPLQSIFDSGVLAASLDRSRERWLSEALFEKYWTKPSKKKGYKEDPKNPARDTMQKVGPCKITIEPHILDATIFAIRRPQANNSASTPSSSVPVSMANPIMQYTPSTGDAPAAYVPQRSNVTQAPKAQTPISTSNPPSPSASARPTPTTTLAASGSQDNLPVVKQEGPTAKAPNPATPITPTPQTAPKPPATNPPHQSQPPPPKQPSQDPVIQMLAQRASTNPDLKVLMKIVASGSATQEQLKVFQGHIDNLTSILQRERGSASQKAQSSNITHTTTPVQGDKLPAKHTPMPQAAMQGKMHSATFQTPAYFQPQPMKATVHSTPKAEITGVAIEFTSPGSSGDRFLFPKDSILEFVPPLRQVIASFLLAQKPDEFSGSTYKSTEEYYQPITIRITSESPKVFEVLAKAVRPAEEVRKRMEDIIENKKRAEMAQLALQLPVDAEGTEAGGGSGSGTPVRGTGAKSSDKRLSVSKAHAPSPLPAHLSSQKAKEPQITWQELHCQFCYIKVAASAQKLENLPVCQPCLMLRRADMFKNPLSYSFPQNSMGLAESERSGPQNLML